MAKEFKSEVLKVLSENTSSRGTTRIRIVSYNDGAPQLEKREFYTDENDEEKSGKAKGFSAADFDILMQNADEIKNLLKKSE